MLVAMLVVCLQGQFGYADDILLLAPSRSAMHNMLQLWEDYARETNLQFSTDSDPDKSKSKCISYLPWPDFMAESSMCTEVS